MFAKFHGNICNDSETTGNAEGGWSDPSHAHAVWAFTLAPRSRMSQACYAAATGSWKPSSGYQFNYTHQRHLATLVRLAENRWMPGSSNVGNEQQSR